MPGGLPALLEPLPSISSSVEVQLRTGDISSYAKKKQELKPPNTLVTTPESLTLLLTRSNAEKIFADLAVVIVDEWHELLGTKRGVQTELAITRLRSIAPHAIVWGLSATLANLQQVMTHLLGFDSEGKRRSGILVQGSSPKNIIIDALLPETVDRLPWAGHLGLKMVPRVIAM